MKLFVKLMLALVVLAMLAPFTVLKNDRGETLMSFSDIGLPDFELPDMPDMPDMPSASKLMPSGSAQGRTDRFYKWYDSQGAVQFTTEPPPAGVEYTVKEFDPNANVIQAVKPRAPTTVEQPAPESSPPAARSTEDLGNPYSKESIEKLFEDTKNIEKMLNDRLKNQNAAIN